MQARVVDLRYHMKEVLQALARNEEVTVLYHGKCKARLIPIQNQKTPAKKVMQHPFFGMLKNEKESVSQTMERLRDNRYDAI